MTQEASKYRRGRTDNQPINAEDALRDLRELREWTERNGLKPREGCSPSSGKPTIVHQFDKATGDLITTINGIHYIDAPLCSQRSGTVYSPERDGKEQMPMSTKEEMEALVDQASRDGTMIPLPFPIRVAQPDHSGTAAL